MLDVWAAISQLTHPTPNRDMCLHICILTVAFHPVHLHSNYPFCAKSFYNSSEYHNSLIAPRGLKLCHKHEDNEFAFQLVILPEVSIPPQHITSQYPTQSDCTKM